MGKVIMPSMMNLKTDECDKWFACQREQHSQPAPSASARDTIQLTAAYVSGVSAAPMMCPYVYTAACRMPENLPGNDESTGRSNKTEGTHNVPAKPEEVKIPDRLPSSPDLYHLRV